MSIIAAIPSRANHVMLDALLTDLHDWGVETIVYDNGYDTAEGKAVLNKHKNVVNAHGWPFYEMWNDGWRLAYRLGYEAVALLNDDITLHRDSIPTALQYLKYDVGVIGFDYRRKVSEGCDSSLGFKETKGTYKDGGIWGCGFLVNSATWGKVPPIDKRYHIWYGDDELFLQMNRHGYKTGVAMGAPMEHAMSTTTNKFPKLMARAGEDRKLFASKFEQ